MSAKAKTTRDDVLSFLDSLALEDGAPAAATGAATDSATTTTTTTTTTTAEIAASPSDSKPAEQTRTSTSTSPRASSAEARAFLQFLDDLGSNEKPAETQSPPAPTLPARSKPAAAAAPAPTPASSSKQSSGGWNWSGFLSQAASAVKDVAQSTGGTLDNIRRESEKRARDFAKPETLAKIGSDLRKGVSTIIDTIAPPIPEHESFVVYLADNRFQPESESATSESASDANVLLDDRMEAESSWLVRTVDAVLDAHGAGAATVFRSGAFKSTTSLHAYRGDTFKLPKGFEVGIESAKQLISLLNKHHASDATNQPQLQQSQQPSAQKNEPEAHTTRLLLSVQPVQITPVPDLTYLSFCAILSDPARQLEFKTFSQMLPLTAWMSPEDSVHERTSMATLDPASQKQSQKQSQSQQPQHQKALATARNLILGEQRDRPVIEDSLTESVLLAVQVLMDEYLIARRQLLTVAKKD
ncbi:hypothetical protein GQ42DRAFT_165365 [Ramicandelaber brevisporus]|nr:hypothetical protein GQ42DRAFT_165365 [Ramicandelaber brevisporus]